MAYTGFTCRTCLGYRRPPGEPCDHCGGTGREPARPPDTYRGVPAPVPPKPEPVARGRRTA